MGLTPDASRARHDTHLVDEHVGVLLQHGVAVELLKQDSWGHENELCVL